MVSKSLMSFVSHALVSRLTISMISASIFFMNRIIAVSTIDLVPESNPHRSWSILPEIDRFDQVRSRVMKFLSNPYIQPRACPAREQARRSIPSMALQQVYYELESPNAYIPHERVDLYYRSYSWWD